MVSRKGASLIITSNTLEPRLKTMPAKVNFAIGAVAKHSEGRIESAARLNAPWQDQTGNARSGLKAKARQQKFLVWEVVLFHRVPYGIWLEVAHEGRFQIINPTLREQGPMSMALLTGLLNRAIGGTGL